MDTLTVVGCQFGDEGKGKVIDYLSKKYDITVRFNGGENAGHTVVIGGSTLKYHLVPAGFLQTHVSVIANGVVINLKRLVEEIDVLTKFRKDFDLKISNIAHIVTDLHFARDAFLEKLRGAEQIGTTLKGIGPAYESKFGRYGIRMIDFNDEKKVREKLQFMGKIYQLPVENEQADSLFSYYNKVSKYVTDTSSYLRSSLDDGRSALFETANGTFIDIEFGTYPFVTSSHTTTLGVTEGTGLSPKYFSKFMGVAKAYTTRVGEGQFPTEILGKEGDKLRLFGKEFGTTTGRPRRVGYLDIPMLRRAVKLNSLDFVALTKADILGQLDNIMVGVSYEENGTEFDEFDPNSKVDRVNYESFPTWKDNRRNLEKYTEFIEDELKVPVVLIGTGEERNQMEVRGDWST
jgi:adenylosuccinate synthase